MRPFNWRTLFKEAPPEDFRRPAINPRPTIAIVAVPGKAYILAEVLAAPVGLSLQAIPEHLEPKVIDDLVELLLAVPEVIPTEPIAPNGDWISIDLHGPDSVTERQARWQAGDDLVVAADRDGIQITRADLAIRQTMLAPEEGWDLIRALASAKLWHASIPEECSSCRVDLRLQPHRPDCGKRRYGV